jgi:hypothetical protein
MFTDYKSAALPTELIRHLIDVRYFAHRIAWCLAKSNI